MSEIERTDPELNGLSVTDEHTVTAESETGHHESKPNHDEVSVAVELIAPDNIRQRHIIRDDNLEGIISEPDIHTLNVPVQDGNPEKVHSDGNIISEFIKKTLDPNKYATKKTIAQGLLDVALLTANASQLKYVLQVGNKHEFYSLMLTLIIISIILQAIQAVLCVFLGSNVDINIESETTKGEKLNNAILIVNVFIMGVNILINAFDTKTDDLVQS